MQTVGEPHLQRVEQAGASPEYFRVLAGVQAAIDTFLKSGKLPAEQGVPWAVAGSQATPEALPGLEVLVRRLSAESGWRA